VTSTVSHPELLRSRWLDRLVHGAGLAYIAAMQVFNPLRGLTSDAALFAYGGKLILQGYLPYRDFWDNKPPAIFYTNALGFLLAGGHWLGPTILQGAVLLLTVQFVWLAARDTFARPLPRYAAFTLATFALGNPFVLEGGHLTETYLVLPLIATFCLLRPFDPNVAGVRWTLAGLASAIAFLYKPNGAAIGVVALVTITLHLARRRWTPGRALARLGSYTAGGIVVLALVTALFALAGSARDLWFATLWYNVTSYREILAPSPPGWNLDRLRPLAAAPIALRGLLAAAVASLGVTAIRFATRGRDRHLEDRVILATAWVLADFCFASATGHAYPHYFVPLSLSLAFAAAPLFATKAERRPVALVIAAIAIVVGLLIARDVAQWRHGLAREFQFPERGFTTPSAEERLAAALEPYLRPGEPILAWGHRQGPQLVLGRPPMVRVLSSLHLGSSYGSARWSAQYDEALAKRPPVILDTAPMFFLEAGTVAGSTWIRPLVGRFEDLLRVGYVRLPLESPEYQAFIRRDRWDEVGAGAPRASTDRRR